MGAYVKFKLGITHFTHNYMETSHVTSKIKLFTFQLGAGLNPRPTDNISAVLPSELSGYDDMICSIIIGTSQCVLDVITFPSGGHHPSINTYFFLAVRCNRSINILLK